MAMKYPAGAAIARLTEGGVVAREGSIVELIEYDDVPGGVIPGSLRVGYVAFRLIDGDDCYDSKYALTCACKLGYVSGAAFHDIVEPLTALAGDIVALARRKVIVIGEVR